MKIAIIQPVVPVYREDFYYELQKYTHIDVYVFKNPHIVKNEHTKISSFTVNHIPIIQFMGVQLYNPLPLLFGKYDALVLMMQFNHITTLILLLTKLLHHKKIILWGHGISVKRYLQEEVKPDWKLKWMIQHADGCWVYMDKEYQQWKCLFPTKPIIALNNTISGAEAITQIDVWAEKETLKKKYNISQKRIIIFCARFNTPYRRTDLLLKIIQQVNSRQIGFIIIGDGIYKPDFKSYAHVYDFGTVYDNDIKRELFTIADIYLQPGWVGLSIVEAMAYAKPVFTFRRTPQTLQCVEYSYISEGNNGMIFDEVNECVDVIQNTPDPIIIEMGKSARKLVETLLTPDKMSLNAYQVLKKVLE